MPGRRFPCTRQLVLFSNILAHPFHNVNISGEDRWRLCTGNAPQVLAALRNVALTLIHRTGSREIAASRRTFAAHRDRAFALLLPAA